jgi:murein DD-endopeptidase MepM/ murein hydrolase activator NlpD
MVNAGDEIRAGDRVGQAGNSGWTERPDLHNQAMRSPVGDWWHGDAVPMRFGGRFLLRNQVMRVTRGGIQQPSVTFLPHRG